MSAGDKTPLAGRRVAVIGGGLIGAAAALRLQRAGAQIVLIDPGEERARASWGNASLIASELAEPLASWATLRSAPRRLFAFGGPLDFVWRDADLWLPWTLRYLAACRRVRFEAGTRALSSLLADAAPAWRRLLQDIGRADLFQDTPHWLVWESPETLLSGVAAAKAAATGPAVVRDLASQEAEAARREVSRKIIGGISFEGTAKVADPAEAVHALHAALAVGGAEIITGFVEAVESGNTGVRLRLAGGRDVDADLALIAAGARSAPLLKGAGLKAPLAAERGYHLQYAEHRLAPGAPPLIFEDRFVCVVRVGEAVRVTGFTEIGRPGSPPDPRKWARLEAHVRELGLPVLGEPERWMGARPTLPDFLPAIGRRGRLLYAFGHQHIGLTLAAVTAEAAAELASAAEPPVRLAPFDLARFG
jgi:D-amino-acid dehydrogenase